MAHQAMKNRPDFGLLLLAQSLSAFGEFFGQRMGRKAHNRSNIRTLVSVSIFSALQAFIVTLITEMALPTKITGGQGSLWMWGALAKHPGLWINAFNNTVYWGGVVYLLREPMGALLLVLAFIVADLFIDPFQRVVGLDSTGPPGVGAVVLAILGSLLCLAEMPPEKANQLMEWVGLGAVSEWWNRTLWPPVDRVEGEEDALVAHMDSGSEEEEEGVVVEAEVVSGRHSVFVGGAFFVVALTAGIGIVCTTYFEQKYEMTMFGYAAIDQVLLPVTTLPLAILATYWTQLADILGEPELGRATTVQQLFQNTWLEAELLTLVPFRASMFAREFLFFYLATAFADLSSVYLEMTNIRVVLVWLVAVLACSLGRNFVQISVPESKKSLHILSILSKIIGTALIVWSSVLTGGG